MLDNEGVWRIRYETWASGKYRDKTERNWYTISDDEMPGAPPPGFQRQATMGSALAGELAPELVRRLRALTPEEKSAFADLLKGYANGLREEPQRGRGVRFGYSEEDYQDLHRRIMALYNSLGRWSDSVQQYKELVWAISKVPTEGEEDRANARLGGPPDAGYPAIGGMTKDDERWDALVRSKTDKRDQRILFALRASGTKFRDAEKELRYHQQAMLRYEFFNWALEEGLPLALFLTARAKVSSRGTGLAGLEESREEYLRNNLPRVREDFTRAYLRALAAKPEPMRARVARAVEAAAENPEVRAGRLRAKLEAAENPEVKGARGRAQLDAGAARNPEAQPKLASRKPDARWGWKAQDEGEKAQIAAILQELRANAILPKSRRTLGTHGAVIYRRLDDAELLNLGEHCKAEVHQLIVQAGGGEKLVLLFVGEKDDPNQVGPAVAWLKDKKYTVLESIHVHPTTWKGEIGGETSRSQGDKNWDAEALKRQSNVPFVARIITRNKEGALARGEWDIAPPSP